MGTLSRYCTYKGSIFLNLLGDLKLYKLTRKDEIHNGFEYKTGLNVDMLPFNPTGKRCFGGLYFFDEIQLLDFDRYVNDAYFIRPVSILNYSDVYVEKGKYKVHEFVLGERKVWDNNPTKWIRWSSIDVCKLVLKRSSEHIRYVPREFINYETCLKAVKNRGENLRWIPNDLKTEELCLEAISQSRVSKDTVSHQEVAILKWIPRRFRSVNVLRRCIEQNPSNIRYAKKSRNLTEEMCLLAVSTDGNSIRHIPYRLLTENVCLHAVKNKSFVIEFIPVEKRSVIICKEAVKRYAFNIKHVPEQFIDRMEFEKMCMNVVKRLGYCLSYIPVDSVTLEMCRVAVNDNPTNIRFVPVEYRMFMI